LKVATDAVCKVFNISPDVVFGKSRKYPRKYAFAIWVYLSYTKLNYTLPDLVNYTHKSLSTISKAKGSIDNRKNVTAFEKKINEKLDECILIINQIKSE
jgi:chromosomal replication initiation ATPase DnaA